MSNNNNTRKNNNNNHSKKNNKNSTQNNKPKKAKRSEAAMARRAQKWATQRAQKKAESIAEQKEKQEVKKAEEERKAKTVLELFPNVMSIVGAQGFMPNIKRSTLLSKNLSQKLKNTPLFQNADRSTIYPNGMTLLNKYLSEGNWEEAMNVLDLGVSKKVLEHHLPFGQGPPLVYTYNLNRYVLFVKLLVKGADPNVMTEKNGYKVPLLHSICGELSDEGLRLEYIRALVKHNVRVDDIDRYGYRPLDVCIARGNPKLTKYFIDIGVDIEKPTPKGFTSLLTAVANSQLDVMQYMIEKRKPDLNKQTGPNKLSPLKIAILNAKKEILEELVKHDIDINQKDNQGNTALHYAALTKNYDKMKILLENGANKSIKNNEGITPFDLVKKILNPGNPRTAETLTLFQEH